MYKSSRGEFPGLKRFVCVGDTPQATERTLKQYENPADFVLDSVGGLSHAEVLLLVQRLEESEMPVNSNVSIVEEDTPRSITPSEYGGERTPRGGQLRPIRFFLALHLISFRLIRDVWRDPR